MVLFIADPQICYIYPSRVRADTRIVELVSDLQNIHTTTTQSRLKQESHVYKLAADRRRRHVEFQAGDFVWVALTKDRFSTHEYFKLSARKIGPVEFLPRLILMPIVFVYLLIFVHQTSLILNIWLHTFLHILWPMRVLLIRGRIVSTGGRMMAMRVRVLRTISYHLS